MSRLNKTLTIIILVSIIFLIGCDTNTSSNDSSNSEKISYKPMGRKVLSPVEISYVIDNPIEIIEINDSNNRSYQRSYLKISGLKDKDIENSINDSIKSLYDEMLPYVDGEKLPPYRGIKAAVDTKRDIKKPGNLSVMARFNSNNVLSVEAFGSGNYYGNDNNSIYFYMSKSLNFDLNTGKTFKISDVFTNDVNGLEVVNEAILSTAKNDRLSHDINGYEYSGFALTSPFKGIDHNQKFYITNHGINVIIDYNNPEFNTGFGRNIVTIPFHSPKGYIGITERFYDESSSIYTKKATDKRFLRNYQIGMNIERNMFKKNDIDWSIYTSSPKYLDKKFVSIIEDIKKEEKDLINKTAKEESITYAELNVHAYEIGPYINISNYTTWAGEEGGVWQERSYVYSKSGDPIALEDLFVKNFDYINLIKNTIDKTLKEQNFSNDVNALDLLDGLMFRVEETSISFIANPNNSNISHPLHFNISFKDIGYENLIIFD